MEMIVGSMVFVMGILVGGGCGGVKDVSRSTG